MTGATPAATTLNLAQYTTVFDDNFTADTSLDKSKFPAQWGYPDDFSFGPNGITITSYASEGWSTAGIMTPDWGGLSGNTYGLYQVTATLTRGQGVGPCVVLWPADGKWPGPEIDLLESPDPTRQTGWVNIHYVDAKGNEYTPLEFSLDLTKPHTYAMDWEPGSLTYYIDGQQLFSTNQHVPTTPEAFGAEITGAAQNAYSTSTSITISDMRISKLNGSTAGNGGNAGNTLTVSAADTNGELVLSGTKNLGSAATTKLAIDGNYVGTIYDNQPDGAWSYDTALPAAGAHTITVYFDGTSTDAVTSITIPTTTPVVTPVGPTLTVSAADTNGELVLSGTKALGQAWTTKFEIDGQYKGTIQDNQKDGAWSFRTALPAPGTHTIEVYLDGTSTDATTSITIPPGSAPPPPPPPPPPSPSGGTGAGGTGTPVPTGSNQGPAGSGNSNPPAELNIMLRGQSNAILLAYFGITGKVQAEVQQLLGYDGVTHKINMIADYGNANGDNTMNSGTAFLSQWVTPKNGNWQNGWTVNTLEQGLLNDIGTWSAAEKAAPTATVWLHNEYDSTDASLTPAEWTSAVQFDAGLVRQALGQSAATTPYLFVNAIAYGESSDAGNQAIKVGMQQLAANTSFNGAIAAQFDDTNMDAWNNDANGNPIYGGPHMDPTDAALLTDRLARSIADAFAKYAMPGSPIALAGGHIDDLGPQAAQASVVSGNPHQLLVTVVQDTATSLKSLDGPASQGVGWSVRDSGAAINATAAQIVDPTHILLTFGSNVPTDSAATLYYAYGYGRLAPATTSPNGTTGEGNAVYDNNGLPLWTAGTGVAIGATGTGGTGSGGTGPGGTSTGGTGSGSVNSATTGSSTATSNQTLYTSPGTDILLSGNGSDTLFIDATSKDGWATIENWHTGDLAALLGVNWNVAKLTWLNAADPLGHTGATLDISLTNNGHTDAAITFAGVSVATAQSAAMSSGTYSNGQPFLTLHG